MLIYLTLWKLTTMLFKVSAKVCPLALTEKQYDRCDQLNVKIDLQIDSTFVIVCGWYIFAGYIL